jgi:PPK2 family polyphosphate:nucleotide phosphotransferase
MAKSFTDLLLAPDSPVKLSKLATDAHPGVGSKAEAQAKLPKLTARLADLQERLFAQSRGGTEPSRNSLLLVLQGMDTSGKGGTVKHVTSAMDPGGLRITSFKSPTEEELSHDFLWRIRKALPQPGIVGVFDRSHYEDVLIVRVRDLVPREQWELRYGLINEFEQELADQGTTVVKCFLHISRERQKERLLARLDDPTKLWKYNTGDVAERKLWPAYQEAYQAALNLTSTATAPWFVVPADRKWYRNYAITNLVVETLDRIHPKWPPAGYDVAKEKKRVIAS